MVGLRGIGVSMMDWSYGYVTDIGYTYGYYNELNPLRVRLSLIESGVMPPKIETACELGFGQGISINFHAAGGDAVWYGTDFNPSQALFAKELSEVSGASLSIYDESFEEFLNNKFVPDFDFIGIHGVWSWISEENRKVIVDFVKRKLKLGGVFYVSYNTLPGWSQMIPLRHLLIEHKNRLGAAGENIAVRINAALDFCKKFLESNPLFVKMNPNVVERLERIIRQDRSYLAHEYFNKDWDPMHFSHMAEYMSKAKLSYAGFANYMDYIDFINLTKEQQDLLAKIKDPVYRETVRDFCVNQQFRRDYWIKGIRRLTIPEQMDMFRKESVVLVKYRSDCDLKIKGLLGEATLDEYIYGNILDLLADYAPQKLFELEEKLKGKDISIYQISKAVIVLIGLGYVMPSNDESCIQHFKKKTDKLNSHIMNISKYRGDIGYLVSPVTGGGVPVNRFEQLFVLGILNGLRDPEGWAGYVYEVLKSQGQKLIKDGRQLTSDEENLNELIVMATEFKNKYYEVIKSIVLTCL